MTATVAERLRNGSRDLPGGCIEWTRCVNSAGYGCIGVGGRVLLTHRVAYELVHGPIPPELTVDHLCRNKRCLNTAHMEIVTRAENARRGSPNTGVTHCKRGHELAGRNLIVKSRGAGRTPVRNCRTCANEQRRVTPVEQVAAELAQAGAA